MSSLVSCSLLFGRQDIVTLSYFVKQIEDVQAQHVARTQLDQMIRFAEWFRQAQPWTLTPVVEISGGKLDYEEARLVRIVLRQRARKSETQT